MTRPRRVFKEDAWSSLEPDQQGMLIGVAIGATVAVSTGSLTWIAAFLGLGVSTGWLIGRRRKRERTTPGSPPPASGRSTRPRQRPASKVLTEQERESSLHSAAWYNGARTAEDKTDRAGELATMRDTVPGFALERYETELAEALVGIEKARIGVGARRTELVAEARQLDPLNEVFALRYFNRRFSGHVGEYGLGPIDLVKALGDLCTLEEIDEAVKRSDALIEEGIRMGIGSWDHEPNMAHLRATYPGFREQALSKALDWGHLIHR